jgi:hypothetical protein
MSDPNKMLAAVLQAEELASVDNKRMVEKLIDAAYRKGYAAALVRFAWWEDGVQYVGTTGTTLVDALKKLKEEPTDVQ